MSDLILSINREDISENDLYRIWSIDDWDSVPEQFRGQKILLLKPEELETFPTGSVFLSILGNPVIRGISNDDDTRAGCLSYGLLIKA